jgi:hypothetical protein
MIPRWGTGLRDHRRPSFDLASPGFSVSLLGLTLPQWSLDVQAGNVKPSSSPSGPSPSAPEMPAVLLPPPSKVRWWFDLPGALPQDAGWTRFRDKYAENSVG